MGTESEPDHILYESNTDNNIGSGYTGSIYTQSSIPNNTESNTSLSLDNMQ